MKILIFSVLLFAAAAAPAADIVAIPKGQAVQIVNEAGTPASCRLYRKRVQEFLQRTNEAATATAVAQDSLSEKKILRVLDILRRTDVPLELQKENILWTFDFDVSAAQGFFDLGAVLVEINSTYLQWQTDQGIFPDQMHLDMNADLTIARITYKMSYMEACLAPNTVALKITNELGTSVLMQALVNRLLL